MTNLISFFVTTGSIAGLFFVIETLVAEEHRRQISLYLYSRQPLPRDDFRDAAGNAIVGAFIENERVSLPRTALYSLFSVFLLLVAALAWTEPFLDTSKEAELFYEETGIQAPALSLAGYTALMIYGTLLPALAAIIFHIPFDYVSLRISKSFFYQKRTSASRHLALLVLDFVGSIGLPVMVFIVIAVGFGTIQIVERENEILLRAYVSESSPLVMMIMYSSLLAIFSTSLISVIHAIVIVFGVILNFFSKLFRLPSYLADHSKIAQFPLTSIGLLVGVALATAQILAVG